MVAPFLAPLKSWIKQQHKLDRQKTRNSVQSVPLVGATDEEDLQPELYETTADEAVPVTASQPDDSFADIVARLGRNQPASDTLPELSVQPRVQEPGDPAAELKRLLSVGMGVQSPPVEAPSVPAPNPLLALFQQGASQPEGPQMPVPMPQTPFDQMMPPPIQPHSPHGQHHPRSHHTGNTGPPPPFPFSPHPQDLPIRAVPLYYNGMPTQIHSQFMQPPPVPSANYPINAPTMQQVFNQRNQHPPSQSPPDAHFTGTQGRPAIPPASNLPAPKLNAHTLGLLNAFKVGDQGPKPPPPSTMTVQAQPQHSSHTTPRMLHPLPQHLPHDMASPKGPYAPSSPQFQSPPVSSNFQPEQPKPRTAHQDSLLSLFSATPPVASPEPAELSALPITPGYQAGQPVAKFSKVTNPSLETFGPVPRVPGITTATVSGPINAPDFDTMKKSIQSPATQMPFMPQQILKRGQLNSAPRSPMDVSSPARNGTSQNPVNLLNQSEPAIDPQIVKRSRQQNVALAPVPGPNAHAQSLLDMFKAASPQPVPIQPAQPAPSTHSPAPPTAPSTIDQRESIPNEQKSTLLALFGSKPSPAPQHSYSPIPQIRSSLSPSPKTTVSGIMSPVSPLPAAGSQSASPADRASRSRISSIGECMTQSAQIAPTSHPVAQGPGEEGSKGNASLGGRSATGKAGTDGKSPVDKTFLLGFLEDVARRGR